MALGRMALYCCMLIGPSTVCTGRHSIVAISPDDQHSWQELDEDPTGSSHKVEQWSSEKQDHMIIRSYDDDHNDAGKGDLLGRLRTCGSRRARISHKIYEEKVSNELPIGRPGTFSGSEGWPGNPFQIPTLQ